jgi:multicomponent Na+:H+ antiporter subunit A
VLAGLASLFILAFLAPWLGDRLAARFGYSAALTSFVLFGWYASQLPAVTHGPTRVETISWLPTLGADLTLRLDGLGLLFALLVTGIGALIALYSVAYLAHHPRRRAFWVAFLAFEAAMLGLVLADDVILLFVFWELTSITSFFLIGLENERERARTSATQALIVTGSGGLALLTGLLILVQRTGSLRLSEILAQGPLDADGLVTTAFLLILLGAAAKSAQVPLHFWLPNAMEAPTPVSAYLHSATMVKAGVYLLARMTPAFGEHPWWQPSLGVLGGATALVGALLAVQQRDLKRLLAYSTISALGTLVFLLSFGEPGWLPFALFLLAHALYKGGAFLLAGAIDHATGERVLDRLGGLAGLFPGLAIVAGLVVLAAAGLPPTLSFVAKELVLETSWHELPLPGLLVLLAALSGQTAVAWLLVRPFVGQPRTAPEHAHAPAWQLLTAPALLGAAASLSGLLTRSLGPLASAVVASLSGHEPTSVKLALWHGLTPALGLSLLVLLLGGALAVSWPIALRLGDRLRTTESWSPTAGALAAWGSESWYFRTLAVINSLAIRQTRLLQSGYLRVYVMVTVLTLVSLSLLTVGRYRAELLAHWSRSTPVSDRCRRRELSAHHPRGRARGSPRDRATRCHRGARCSRFQPRRALCALQRTGSGDHASPRRYLDRRAPRLRLLSPAALCPPLDDPRPCPRCDRRHAFWDDDEPFRVPDDRFPGSRAHFYLLPRAELPGGTRAERGQCHPGRFPCPGHAR